MEQDTDRREFVHCIDRRDRISSVNRSWLAFAAENGWEVSADRLLATPLFSQIVGAETRHIYRLIDRVRETGRPRRFSYRCDSPDCRRLMEMRITGKGRGELEFRSRVVRLERRDPIVLLDTAVPERSADTLTVCSWCKAVRTDHAWVEVEDAVRRTGMLADAPPPRISHGICPTCSEHMLQASQG
jgi:hypothetical protein